MKKKNSFLLGKEIFFHWKTAINSVRYKSYCRLNWCRTALFLQLLFFIITQSIIQNMHLRFYLECLSIFMEGLEYFAGVADSLGTLWLCGLIQGASWQQSATEHGHNELPCIYINKNFTKIVLTNYLHGSGFVSSMYYRDQYQHHWFNV